MEVLKDYPQEFAKMFETSISFLFKINLKFWFGDENWVTKYWRFLYIVPILMIFFSLLTLDIYKQTIEGDIFEIAYQLPPFLVGTQAIIKLGLLVLKSTEITHIIKDLGALWRSMGLTDKQLKSKRKILKRVNFCNTGTYWISLYGSFQYLISPLFETLFNKFILEKDSELMLPISASSYPFNPAGNWIVYFAVYAFQIYSMFLCVFVYVGTEMIMITLTGLLSMEFIMLCEDMLLVRPKLYKNNIVEDGIIQDGDTYTIEDFVKKHQKMISLSRQIDNVFNIIIFVDFLFAGGTTCFFIYSAQFSRRLTDKVNNYMAVLTTLSYVLFLCYYGELLTRASLQVGEAAYENNRWYTGNKQYQKIILMVIKRSQNACCLTSMRYTPITLNMFTKFISTTWSYISLMNSVYGEE